MSATSEEYTCPVCGAFLDFAPWEGNSPSDEICPCCGIQFGYNDATGGDLEARLLAYERWRDRWLAEGARWSSRAQPKPDRWSAAEQLRRVGVQIENRALAERPASLSPVSLLASTAAVFCAPVSFVFVASLLDQQGSLGLTTLPGSLQTFFWVAGVAALLIPLSFPRLLRRSPRPVLLVQAIAFSFSAAVFGTVLTITSGALHPVWTLSAASMLAILGWAWVYRSSYESDLPMEPLRRYTILLIVVGLVCLAEAGMRIAFWPRAAGMSGGPAANGFHSFLHGVVGLAALAVARLRRQDSPLARPSTQVLSWGLLFIAPVGTAAAIYWLVGVRRRELNPPPQPALAGLG